jgi:hypothetical protein
VRIALWLQAEEDASSQYAFSSSSYSSWFTNRENPAFNVLGSNRSTPFMVASGGRAPIATSANTINLVGMAPLRVYTVEVAGHPETQCTWVNESTWSVTDIILHNGVNELLVTGAAMPRR